jgi:hypothetical protein
MRWYKFYFKVKDNWYDPLGLEPDFWHHETMGIKSENKEMAIKDFWSRILDKHKEFFRLEKVEEGRLEEEIMKLTKEDIQKYGTVKEQKMLRKNIEKLLGKERNLFFDQIIDEINEKCMSFGEGMGNDDIAKKILLKIWSDGYEKGYSQGKYDPEYKKPETDDE